MKQNGYLIVENILTNKTVKEGLVFNNTISMWSEELIALSKITPDIEKEQTKYTLKVKKDKPAELENVTFEIDVKFDSTLRNKIKRDKATKGMMTVRLLDGSGVLNNEDYVIKKWEIPYTIKL